MEDLNVVDSINGAGSWLVANQALLLSYAVNIVAALAIIIVGLIIARMISNAVNRLMIANRCTGPRGCTNSVSHCCTRCRRLSGWSGFAGVTV